MPAPAHILTKVRFLLNLSASSNPNEAASATSAAQKLIEKYGITNDELESTKNKPVYAQDTIIFKEILIVGWKQQLALACAKQFYCYIVIETLVSPFDNDEYTYYAYGEDDDIGYVKFAFNSLSKKVEYLVNTRCIGRGPRYISSYCEGVVESLKNQIYSYGIEIPENMRKARTIVQEEKILNDGDSNLATTKTKVRPEKESTDVASGSLISDIGAYFKGVEDGKDLSIQDVLELESDGDIAIDLIEQ